MKINYLFGLFAFLFFSLVSCHNDDLASNIILEKNNTTVWVGQKDSIAILSENSMLSVMSDDEEIATATIENKNIVISAHEKPGKTILRLKYGQSDEFKLEVYVQTLSGAWKETETTQFKCEVIIDAKEQIIKENIKENLFELIAKQLNTIYGFYADTQKLEIITREGNRKNGSFQFGNEELTMNYDNEIRSYKVSFLGLKFIRLTQDFTEDFKKQYPEAGINNVLVNRYLLYISL